MASVKQRYLVIKITLVTFITKKDMKNLIFVLLVLIFGCEKQDFCFQNEVKFEGKIYIDQPLGESCGYPYSYSGAMHPGDSSIVRVILLTDKVYEIRKSKIYELRSNEKLYLE